VAVLFAASSGCAVAAPDYLGLGRSPVAVHPYLHAPTEATAAVDLLRAARTVARELDVLLSGELFLAGYSQGGHATMALHRALERDHADEFPVTASAPMAGPYDLSGEGLRGSFAEDALPGASAYYSAFLLVAYQSVYGNIYASPSDAFRAPYDAQASALFDGSTGAGSARALLPSTPSELVTPAFRDAILSDLDHPFVRALREAGDVHDWAPRAPVRLFHGGADRDVPIAHAVSAQDRMRSLGASSVELVNVGAGLDHQGAFLPSLLAACAWFNSLR
jgi:pimeloyl-ACP methyl ester carboxylesterase